MTLVRRTFHHIRRFFSALPSLRHQHPLLQSGITAAICGIVLFAFFFLLLPLIFASLFALALVAALRNPTNASAKRTPVIIEHEKS